MDKLIYSDSNDALVAAAEANGEQMATLIETDAGVKSAASQLIDRSLLEQYRPQDKDHVLIHLIGMGNSQQYGFNRNGDWFDGPVLEKRAHTFVTNGHMFKEHRNKDPKKAIGSIKYAAYDPKGMQRVEILVHLDRNKAPEAYEMAKKGSALNFSMSCRVPNDRCSCCGNKAKTVSAYCDCLKNHMGQYMDKYANYAFAYNDMPTFFDISWVKNPADRIARHLEYLFQDDSMAKAAAVRGDILIPSAVLAEAEGVNLTSFDLDEQLVLTKLASAEEYIADVQHTKDFYTDKRANACYGSYPFALLEPLSQEELTSFRSTTPQALFGTLAKRACMLSFPAFCQYISGDPDVPETPLFKKASLLLPSIFGDMMKCMSSIHPMTSLFSAGSPCKKDDPIQQVMDKAEDKFSLREGPVQNRVIRIVISIGGNGGAQKDVEEKLEKASSDMSVSYKEAYELANAYGQYQVRSLCDMRDSLGPDTFTDGIYDVVAGANSVLVYDR